MTGKRLTRLGQDLLWARGTWLALSVLLLAATLTDSAGAFDGKRRGFVLELGIGPALSSSIRRETEGGSLVLRQVPRFAALSRFRVGVGISDRWTLTYVNDVAWTLESHALVNETLYGTGLTGIGSTVFFGPARSPWTAEAAAGFSVVSDVGGGATSETGTGIELGMGRELTKGLLARLTFGRAWFRETQDRTSVGLTFSRVWY